MELEQILFSIARNRGIESFNFVVYEPITGSYNRALRHPNEIFEVDHEMIDDGFIEEIAREHGCGNRLALGISSRVIKESEDEGHLTLIDFDCGISPATYGKVWHTLIDLGQDKGYIINSGGSFYYVGERINDKTEWSDLLKRMGEYPIIGKDWPMFQQGFGFSVLRLTSTEKKPHKPEFVARFNIEPCVKLQ